MDASQISTIWIFVANATEARCYATKHLGQELHLIKEYSHPENRKKAMDMVSDKQGHYQSRGPTSTVHGAYSERHDPKAVEADRFAHILADDLDKACVNNHFHKLVLIAPPHFHGLLNTHLNHRVTDRITHNIEKDYTKSSTAELMSHLSELPRF